MKKNEDAKWTNPLKLSTLGVSIVLAFAPISGQLIAGEPDLVGTINAHRSGVTSLDFSPAGDQILSGSQNGEAKTWNARNGSELNSLKNQKFGLNNAQFSPSGHYVVTTDRQEGIKIWEASSGRVTRTFPPSAVPQKCLAVSDDGQYIATAGEDHKLTVWRVADSQPMYTVEAHTGTVADMEFSPDSEYLATVGQDGAVKIWEVVSGYLAFSYQNTGSVADVTFSPNGMYLGIAGDDARVVELRTGQVVHTMKDHKGSVLSICYSPDGKYVATGSTDKTVKMWSTATGRMVATLKDQDAAYSTVAFSPDGRLLAAGSSSTLPNTPTGAPPLGGGGISVWNVLPVYPDQQISGFVERELYHWRLKGEFEKESDYQARLEKIDQEAGRLFTKAFRQYSDDVRETSRISRYDAETEHFTITLPSVGEFTVNIPIEKAEMFKKRFSEVVFRNFIIEPELQVPAQSSWTLKKVELYLPSAKQSFHYSAQ